MPRPPWPGGRGARTELTAKGTKYYNDSDLN